MKNRIFIDVDTERDVVIRFAKSVDIPEPENEEESAAMLLNDIVCLSEALQVLITIADKSGYAKKTDLVHASVKTIYEALNNNPIETETPNESEENSANSTDNGNT